MSACIDYWPELSLLGRPIHTLDVLEVLIAVHHAFDPLPPFLPVWLNRDRMMLLKLEQDILEFINDDT